MLLSDFPALLDSLATSGSISLIIGASCFAAVICAYRFLISKLLGGAYRV